MKIENRKTDHSKSKGPALHLNYAMRVIISLSLLFFAFVSLNGNENLGLICIFASLIVIVFCNEILVFLYAVTNLMVSFALDYYIRVRPGLFLFYDGSGSSVHELAIVSLGILLVLFLFEGDRIKRSVLEVYIPELGLKFDRLFAWLFVPVVLGISFFIVWTSGLIVNENFNFENIGRFSILEYFSLLSIVTLWGKYRSKLEMFLFFSVNILFLCVLVLGTYRLASSIVALAIFLRLFSGRSVSKIMLAAIISSAAFLFSIIGIVRGGHEGFEIGNLIGYKQHYVLGRIMDNTFTGVVETSLQYTAIKDDIPQTEKTTQLIGLLLPVPGSFLPLDYHYVDDIHRLTPTRVPGGGTLAGFFLYFDFWLAPFVLVYLFLALQAVRHKRGGDFRSRWSAALFLIATVTVMRWSIYGPYVLFKFFGVFVVIMLAHELIFGRRTIWARPSIVGRGV